MPGFDGTGPIGQGPGSGRGMGYCYGDQPRGWFRGFGLGLGMRRRFGGRGRGWGFRGYNNAPPAWTQDEQVAAMQDRIDQLEAEIAAMRNSNENRNQ